MKRAFRARRAAHVLQLKLGTFEFSSTAEIPSQEEETVKWLTIDNSQAARTFARRTFLGTAIRACAVTPILRLPLQLGTPGSGSLTTARDYVAEKRSSAAGQYPAAVILGCVDSRVPAEIVFDVGIGDTFNGRGGQCG